MKKIFAFAMAVVSMAAVMTSCSNEEAEFIEQKPTTYNNNTYNDNDKQAAAEDETEQVVEIFLAVTDVQLEIMDIEFTYSIRGRQTTIGTEMMTEIEFPARIPDNDAAGKAKLLKFRVPGTFTMFELRNATLERNAKLIDEGVAKYLGQKVNLFNNYTCTVTEEGKEAHFNVAHFNYTPNVNLTETRYFEKVMDNYQFIGQKSPIIYTL